MGGKLANSRIRSGLEVTSATAYDSSAKSESSSRFEGTGQRLTFVDARVVIGHSGMKVLVEIDEKQKLHLQHI
jgi:hypothetical protein